MSDQEEDTSSSCIIIIMVALHLYVGTNLACRALRCSVFSVVINLLLHLNHSYSKSAQASKARLIQGSLLCIHFVLKKMSFLNEF